MACAKKSKVRASRGAGAAWAPKVAMATVETMVEARIVKMKEVGGIRCVGLEVEESEKVGTKGKEVERGTESLDYIPVGEAGSSVIEHSAIA